MIQQETELEVADNTGAEKLQCIKVLGGSKRRYASVGDVIVCSVKSAKPNSSVKKKAVVKALIVRTKKCVQRKDGSTIRFDKNSAVIVDEKGNPKGTRVFGSICREIRENGYIKICSLAPEVI